MFGREGGAGEVRGDVRLSVATPGVTSDDDDVATAFLGGGLIAFSGCCNAQCGVAAAEV
jgi:hypothetical protein